MPLLSSIQNIASELRDRHVRQMLLLPFTLPFAVRPFMAERPTLVEVKAQLNRELANREQRFSELVRTRVYNVPESPYKKLLDHAGCEHGDLDSLLGRLGLDETLKQLAREGVYLTTTEYKGKEDVVRSGLSFRVSQEDFLPPRRQQVSAIGFSQTSGSTNRPTVGLRSLDWWREETPVLGVFLEAHNLLSTRMAVYEPMLAGVAAGLMTVLSAARLGVPLDRWFARPVPINNWLEGLYFRFTAHELALACNWFGPGFARPEMVPHDQLDRIVRWIEKNRMDGRSTCIRTVASNAARIARTADEIGACLEGCTFIASGEPVTTAKRRVIEKVGGTVTVLWGYEPIGTVGLGCARPVYGDEMHVLKHSLAVIEHPDPIVEAGGAPVHPLLFTTLYPSAARLEINVSNGDQAVLSERPCGCPMQEAGLTLHVHNVGSFEKLTGEGLAFPFDDLFELLETTLPDAFGGGAGDYQLLEEEDAAGGQTYLTLLVDPAVGPIDEAKVLDALASELARGSRNKRFAAGVWQKAGTLRLRRATPLASSRGKILPLRVARKTES